LIGRVEVKGVPGFDESTSRNQGLIRTPEVDQLVNFVIDKCVRRLERYVVDITWRDQLDKDIADTSRMRLDESSALVAQLVSRLAATEGVELLEYNPEIVRIVDEKSTAFEASLRALEMLADETGDEALLTKVDEAKARIKALQAAEAEAREAERRAENRALAAEQAAATAQVLYSEERQRNDFLVSAASLDEDTILNLHHQIMIHATDVHHDVKRMMGKIRTGEKVSNSDWIDFLERISYRNSQILTATRFATKGGYKQQSAEVEADLSLYIRDYIETVSSLWAPRGVLVEVDSDDKPAKRKFKPIEVGIVIDNLVSNAVKARATTVRFTLRVGRGAKPEFQISVADDGSGWPTTLKPLDRVFEKGVTTTDGSGLGLYHVRRVIQGMRGEVEANAEPFSNGLDGAHLTIRLPE
jgi:signal transduction histidine kinase